jgi:hypothetical protein
MMRRRARGDCRRRGSRRVSVQRRPHWRARGRCSGGARRRRERLRVTRPGTRIRASDGRAIDDIPVDERLTPELAQLSAAVVRDFIVPLRRKPDGPATPHDLASTFRSLQEDGDLSIEPMSGGFRVVPLTGMGLYNVGQFLWRKRAKG